MAAAYYSSYLSQKQLNAFHSGIAEDKAYLQEQGDAAAKDDAIVVPLLAGDREGLFAAAAQEQKNRAIGIIGITDAKGIVLARTTSSQISGDNAFLTLPIGRAVAQGESVQSVESRFDSQLVLGTGRPILHDGSMAGGLFASYLMDDKYASRFRHTYLSSGTEVAFYTKGYGVYGNSFADEDTRSLIQSYFNPGSEWIANGVSGKVIAFPDGTSYIVMNVVFPGLEQSPGGALLFVPRIDLTPFANGITALLVVLAFVFFVRRFHARIQKKERGRWYYLALGVSSLIVYGFVYVALHSQSLGQLQLKRVPYPLYNSTIRLHPEDGVYGVDSEQRASIIVDSGDENINAVQAELHFDPSMVEVKSLDVTNSACSFFVENTVDRKSGTARVSCVILDRGPDQHSYSIADVVFVPKRAGTFALLFDAQQTQVLANDGLGTNVLRASQDSSYTAESFEALSRGASATSSEQSPIIFSPTHPNQSRWYNVRTARFVWLGSPGSVYDYAFDRSPGTVPTDEHTIQGTSLSIPIANDGVFYLHLRSAQGGTVAHYRINVDITPPTILAMKLSQDTIVAGDVVRLFFHAEDPTSGVQNDYYVDLGDHLFLPVGPQLYIPFLEAGDQKVTLRVYDSAGNYSEETRTIHVRNN